MASSQSDTSMDDIISVQPLWWPAAEPLSNCTMLELVSKGLEQIPCGLSLLSCLLALDLQRNALSRVPDWISLLTSLTQVRLNENELPAFPAGFRSLSLLRSLAMQDNRIAFIPEWISSLCGLTFLRVDGNMISSIPENISFLKQLVEFNISGNKIETLPAAITHLEKLSRLFIQNESGEISTRRAPDGISNLPCWNETFYFGGIEIREALHGLTLFSPQLQELEDLDPSWRPCYPDKLENCSFLSIVNKGLTRLPGVITRLTSLQGLYLSHNMIQAFPDTFECFSNLESLDLSFNRLKYLPDGFEMLTRLKTLNLGDNQFTGLPSQIFQHPNLLELYMGGNCMTLLESGIKSLTCLKILSIHSNPIYEIPVWFTSMDNLDVLEIEYGGFIQIKRAPAEITSMNWWRDSWCKHITLYDPDIEKQQAHDELYQKYVISVEQRISREPRLLHNPNFFGIDKAFLVQSCAPFSSNHIVFEERNIKMFPVPQKFIMNVQVLVLSKNKMSELPVELTQLQNLSHLDISRNEFVSLPQFISHMTSLRVLKASNCPITSIPTWVPNMINLQELIIRDGKIDDLAPSSYESCVSNSALYFDVTGNPIEVHIPKFFLKGNFSHFLEYMKALLMDMTSQHETKFSKMNAFLKEKKMRFNYGRLFVMGKPGSGKSSLCTAIFDMENQLETTENEFECKVSVAQTYSNVALRVTEHGTPTFTKITEINGDVDINFIKSAFMFDGTVCIITYNIIDREELEYIKQAIEMLSSVCNDLVLVIVGTHGDKCSSIQKYTMLSVIADITKPHEHKFQAILNDLVVDTQKKEDVSPLIKTIYDCFLCLDLSQKHLPSIYLQVAKHIKSFQSDHTIIKTSDFLKDIGLLQQYTHSSLEFLHSFGEIVYSRSSKLGNYILLSPEFLVELSWAFIKDIRIKQNHGFLIKSKIPGIIKENKLHLIYNDIMVLLADNTEPGLVEEYEDTGLTNIHQNQYQSQNHTYFYTLMSYYGMGFDYNEECFVFPFLHQKTKIKSVWPEKAANGCCSEFKATIHLKLPLNSQQIVRVLQICVRKVNKFGRAQQSGLLSFSPEYVILKFSLPAIQPVNGMLDFVPGDQFQVLIFVNDGTRIDLHFRSLLESHSERVNYISVFNSFASDIISLYRNLVTTIQIHTPVSILVNSPEIDYSLLVQSHKDSPHGKLPLDLKVIEKGFSTQKYTSDNRASKGHKFRHKYVQDGNHNITGEMLEQFDTDMGDIFLSNSLELDEYIGCGTFGRVYKTQGYGSAETVVKIQSIGQAMNIPTEEILASITYECKFLQECRPCRNIISLIGVYRKGFDFYIALEYGGDSLKQLIEWEMEHPLTTSQKINISFDVCQGLQFMKSINLYHEDIRAENILFDKGIAKIADFGMVSKRSPEKVGSHLHTCFGEWKQRGFFNWQAPEIHEVICKPHYAGFDDLYGNERVNIGHRGESSCTYALGLLIWYMFSGTEPFLGDIDPRVLVVSGIRPDIPPQIPKGIQHLIRMCWRQNYKQRPSFDSISLYLAELLSTSTEISEEKMKKLLPITYTEFSQMYRGEWVEFLNENGCFSLSKKVANEDWACADEIEDRFSLKKMADTYHIDHSEVGFLVQLSQEKIHSDSSYPEKQFVWQLSCGEIVQYFEGSVNPRIKKLAPKIKSLWIDGDVLSKINDPEIRMKYSISHRELEKVAELVEEKTSPASIRPRSSTLDPTDNHFARSLSGSTFDHVDGFFMQKSTTKHLPAQDYALSVPIMHLFSSIFRKLTEEKENAQPTVRIDYVFSKRKNDTTLKPLDNILSQPFLRMMTVTKKEKPLEL